MSIDKAFTKENLDYNSFEHKISFSKSCSVTIATVKNSVSFYSRCTGL